MREEDGETRIGKERAKGEWKTQEEGQRRRDGWGEREDGNSGVAASKRDGWRMKEGKMRGAVREEDGETRGGKERKREQEKRKQEKRKQEKREKEQ